MLSNDRRANATLFGFDFQVNAAIVLMLDNIKKLQSLRLESNNEDIDIELDNGSHILAQAKAIVNSSTDFRNVRKNKIIFASRNLMYNFWYIDKKIFLMICIFSMDGVQ